jgi:tetrahydromethanopterin S-methyltransferase subunit F
VQNHHDADECEQLRSLEIKILNVEHQIHTEVSSMKATVEAIQDQIAKLVTRDRFDPVAYIAYGLAAGVLTSALGALMSKVLFL